MKIQTPNSTWVSILASGGLLLLLVALFCPSRGDSQASAAVNTDVSVSNESTVSISIDPTVAMEAMATTSNGKFTSGNAHLTVTTNSPAGYKVFMTSANTGQTTLKDSDASNTTNINSITANIVGNKMTGNTWGYSIGTTAVSATSTFKPIPANSNSAIYSKTSASANSGDSYQLGFGAHVDTTLPAGTYTNSMVVSVVANPKPEKTLTDILQMQEMTTAICTKTSVGTNKVLLDTRDNKTYYVTKLPDNRCWMTQNLGYETSTSQPAQDQYANRTGHESYGRYYRSSEADSVCPSAWRLPTGGEGGEFQSLVNSAGLTASNITEAPYYWQMGGNVNYGISGSTSTYNYLGVGTSGNYWASTIITGGGITARDALTFNTSSIDSTGTPGSGTSISYYTIRCIAK